MGRPRTGCIEPYRTARGAVTYRARIRLGDGTRVRVVVPEKYAYSDERAKLYAAALQEREDETGELLAEKRRREHLEASQRDTSDGETSTLYRERLEIHRAALGRRGSADDLGTWRKWIQPHIGHIPITKVTRDEVERVRDALDEAIALHGRTGGEKGIGAKRARNAWTTLTTTFAAACTAKRKDLRVRGDNPCDGVLPPESGPSRHRTFIYPNEVRALLACAAVPRDWRELYAIACYTYLRPGELRALTWADVDLDAGVIHVTKAWDERAKELKTPKTRHGVRDVPIHPSLMPVLERLSRGRDGGALVVPIMKDW